MLDAIMSDSAGQLVAKLLTDVISSFLEHKKTPEYQTAVERSQKQGEEHKRLNRQLWWAQYNYTKGRSLHIKVLDGIVKFDDLESEEQKLVEAFDSRQSAKVLNRLLEQKQPLYRGVGSEADRQC